MNLHTMTLDEFLCVGNIRMKEASPFAFEAGAAGLAEFLPSPFGQPIKAFGEGYEIHSMTSADGDVCLLFDRSPVGFYWGEALAVANQFQGNGLSIPLILAAVPSRQRPERRTLSVNGRKALERAWRVARGHEANPWP